MGLYELLHFMSDLEPQALWCQANQAKPTGPTHVLSDQARQGRQALTTGHARCERDWPTEC